VRSLTVSSGPGVGQSLEVEQEVVIGRENADLTIDDPEISRRHAVIRPIERGVEVEDLGSLNGTFVNGERIEAAVPLTVTGTVRVGDSEIQVELELVQATKARDIPSGLDATKVRAVAPPAGDPALASEAAPPPAPPTPPETQEPQEPAPAAAPPPPETDVALPRPPAQAPPETPPGGPRESAPPPRYGAASEADRKRRLSPVAMLVIGVLIGVAIAVVIFVVLGV
jgi:predicted component of type VI protein secretion system